MNTTTYKKIFFTILIVAPVQSHAMWRPLFQKTLGSALTYIQAAPQPSIQCRAFSTQPFFKRSTKQNGRFFEQKYSYLFSGIVLSGTFGAYAYKKQKDQQTMSPSSMWQQKQPVSAHDKKQCFINDVTQNAAENKKIPSKQADVVRLMTFNVHFWHDALHKKSYQDILKTIKDVNPDVIILQEVIDWPTIAHDFEALGYQKNVAACNTKKGRNFFGNIMMTKIPPTAKSRGYFHAQERPGQEDRCWVCMDFEHDNGKKFSLYGTHLEVGFIKNYEEVERIRQQQVQEIIDHINSNQQKNALIAGDFNALRAEDYNYTINTKNAWNLIKDDHQQHFGQLGPQTYALDTLKNAGFHDSFTALNKQKPKFTTWSDRVVDFMFLTPEWQLPLDGSYVYHTPASDHLPIIVDIKL